MMPGLSPLWNKQVALFGKQKPSILYFKVFSIKRVIPWNMRKFDMNANVNEMEKSAIFPS